MQPASLAVGVRTAITFGSQTRLYRESRGWRISELAFQTSHAANRGTARWPVSESTIRDIETGKTPNPSLTTAFALAQTFNLSQSEMAHYFSLGGCCDTDRRK